ncbi:hypothetical protein Aab01nite_12680 [Paractinoplanes abujensis]|uniref:Uncharacterized protein n=1 Tax=Paractinoplanes abujensis TaxID=882441 RepID=A0A7W7FYD3_9ACTN|nr:hypothetical protein [Actinoplanes abujensis]MBB4690908.1 hypothetical protein [Actinoplanes abujensis]GID17678.1 hypothetical protein Aab01nite_12680 [Actinoplanes abujensis]
MRTRHANAAASLGLFAVLAVFAALTLVLSAPLMSNACIGDSGQMACPVDGPGWTRPVPAAATLLGLLSGLIGVAAGRPLRKPALIAGLTLVAAGLAMNVVIG